MLILGKYWTKSETMNLGSAIKSLRKRKGYSQKKFAEKCKISVNALCQIEVNATFPQKSTIKKICEELDVPVAYLLFFSIDEEDIPKEKQSIFLSLQNPIKDILLSEI